ncbi:MAG: hypothetical protein WC263_02060 [Candidatus Micrarchaeia archaeon]|jgi:hypothetical protein
MRMKNNNVIVPIVKATLKATPMALGLWQCKAPKETVIAPKRPVPVIVVVNDVPDYEIKGSKPGGSVSEKQASLGISINNNGAPNNPKTYYFVPGDREADTIYGKGNKGRKNAATYEFRVNGGMGKFGKYDTINIGIEACNQMIEFLTKKGMVNVSGAYVRLVSYEGNQLFVKDHAGYPSKDHYIINRNANGLAAIYGKDSTNFALWVLPVKMSNYSVKVPFKAVPQGDAAIKLDSNFFAYTSDGRRQIQVTIDQETPFKPAAAVEDFKYVQKNATAFGIADGQNVVYTPTNAVYIGDSVMKYAIGDSVFFTARGDTARALGVVDLANGCKLSKMLGNASRAGMGVALTRTGAVATYWRVIKSDATDTSATPSVVTLPLTQFTPGLKVIENRKADKGKPEVFNPVTCEKLNLFSFITNVPGEKDTMQLRVLRMTDGDEIKIKMGMADVSKITHTLEGKDIHVKLYGKDGIDVVGEIIISPGVKYELIREKNRLLEDKPLGFAPMKSKYNGMLYTDAQEQNRLRSRFAGRNI